MASRARLPWYWRDSQTNNPLTHMVWRKIRSELQQGSSSPMNTQIDAAQAVASEAAISSIATKWGMTGGTITTILGWASSNSFAVFVGILATVLGFIVNYVYQRRRDLREETEAAFRREMEVADEARRIELHQAQLAALKHNLML